MLPSDLESSNKGVDWMEILRCSTTYAGICVLFLGWLMGKPISGMFHSWQLPLDPKACTTASWDIQGLFVCHMYMPNMLMEKVLIYILANLLAV